MNRKKKTLLTIFGFAAIVTTVTSCNFTKPLLSSSDKAQQMYSFYANNVVVKDEKTNDVKFDENNHTQLSESYIKNLNSAGILVPCIEFTNFIDDKVNEYIKDDSNFSDEINALKDSQSPEAYIRVKRGLALFGGYQVKDGEVANPAKIKLWHNFDNWYKEYNDNQGSSGKLVSDSWKSSFKKQVNNGIASLQAGITPVSGWFNSGTTYITGKSWGQAFKEYGFFEGLFVYPIAIMLHYFTVWFGDTGIGQVLAILLVTIIVRLVLVIFSIFTTKSQNKMTLLQPQVAELNNKYPNAENDKNQKAQLSRETMQLYKKNGVHPMLQFVVLIIQFPLFIFVYAAMQGSAALTNGSVFSLSLTQTLGPTVMSWGQGAPFALVLFMIFIISQIISSQLPMWFQSWQTKNFVRTTVENSNGKKAQTTMKIVSWVMVIMMGFLGFNAPAAMIIYWFFGSLISIVQTLIMQGVTAHSRRKHSGDSGSGSSLASQRRSKNHGNNIELKSSTKKTKSIRSGR